MAAVARIVSRILRTPFGLAALGALALTGIVLLNASGAFAPTPSARAVAAYMTVEKMVVEVDVDGEPFRLRRILHVDLLDDNEKVIATAERPMETTWNPGRQRFELLNVRNFPDKLVVRCRLDKQEETVGLESILLTKPHETILHTGRDFFSGSTAAVRCEVRGLKSMSETVPLADAAVEITFTDWQKREFPVFKGKTDSAGVAAAEFRVPTLAAGQYTMTVVTRSPYGEDRLANVVTVHAGSKVLLVTDKPLYQPGQLIHLRALVLRAFDLQPVARTPLLVEIEDGKGNKVFKRDLTTSDYGIASIDFQLASEVNNGDYHIRAILVGDTSVDKTVVVKPYSLPKFKTTLTADKTFYLARETLHIDLQSDYFFGKPVAAGKVTVRASAVDKEFSKFLAWEGTTDEQGHAKFDVKLPDAFAVKSPEKVDAFVQLDVKITDSADHEETLTRTFPVGDEPIRVHLIPEGGRLVPEMPNRIFAAATYPDGSPAQATVQLWLGATAKDKPFATAVTDSAGLCAFVVTPEYEQFRKGKEVDRRMELFGDRVVSADPAAESLIDLTARARNDKGDVGQTSVTFKGEPFGANVMLRLDKAVYAAGDPLNVDLRSSAAAPTARLDVVRGGQTLLTKSLTVKDGKASQRIDLPASAFGTVEVHVSQVVANAEVVRDGKVVYVQPAQDLTIQATADKNTYLPGAEGKIRFAVTDSAGKPAAAALGVLVVDEAVYALQEMRPGLEKVYFMLQEELLKPTGQTYHPPGAGLEDMVRQPVLTADKQRIAEVLLTTIKPLYRGDWDVDPSFERRQRFDRQIDQIGLAVIEFAAKNSRYQVRDSKTNEWIFAPGLLEQAAKEAGYNFSPVVDPLGERLNADLIAKRYPGFQLSRLNRALFIERVTTWYQVFTDLADEHRKEWFKDGRWNYPEDVLTEVAKNITVPLRALKDPWEVDLRIVKLDKRRKDAVDDHLAWHAIVSAGPDGKFGTADDLDFSDEKDWTSSAVWWLNDASRAAVNHELARSAFHYRSTAPSVTLRQRTNAYGEPIELRGINNLSGFAGAAGFQGGFQGQANLGVGGGAAGVGGGGVLGGGALGGLGALGGGLGNARTGRGRIQEEGDIKAPPATGALRDAGGANPAAPPVRLREYFPETLAWQPQLITDDHGVAVLPIDFADSITTWRLTASASSRGGLLGGVSMPLRVFQDFFVDVDLPLSLTQNDEVAFPVAVFNYLKDAQTVRLDLQPEPWFELADGQGYSRVVDLKAGEVLGVKFRIRAKKIGHFPLTVKAVGGKMSDAIKRSVDVAPDGRMIEQAVSDRLSGTVHQTISVPKDALADASKLFLKVHPGVFSQLLEGVDGLLQMPSGCFEQTSSSAYPNLLVVDYLRKNRLNSPVVQAKAEGYLNAGYQRLLTFERPGGGFDLWGRGEPEVWLSAYGLLEFSDMAKVYPVDQRVIERTRDWLLTKKGPDGVWNAASGVHGPQFEQMGDPKLLLTSYVTWSLLQTGVRKPELRNSIHYIRANALKSDNAYTLALAANALAGWDDDSDSVSEVLATVLKKLQTLRKDLPEWKACCFPSAGQSLSFARDDSLTVETTALTALAMLKQGKSIDTVNKSLAFLVKSKDAHGTWGSTQATVLSLKALASGAAGAIQKGEVSFVVKLAGKEVAHGAVTPANNDVMQFFDLSAYVHDGANEVTIETKGETSLLYQIVGRSFVPWPKKDAPDRSVVDLSIDYDRTTLSTGDVLKARATLKYNGTTPTYQVIADLGIPPGFTAEPADFTALLNAKKVERFSLNQRQAVLYIGDVKPGQTLVFDYRLRPKYPTKVTTPPATAYEYYTPANRAEARPTLLVVTDGVQKGVLPRSN